MKLDLGCGTRPADGHVGVDLPIDAPGGPDRGARSSPFDGGMAGEDGIVRFDFASGIPWPWKDESIEGLRSSHLIEHLPPGPINVYRWHYGDGRLGWNLRLDGSQDVLFWFLDEAWRVTKPGGQFDLRWPALFDERPGGGNAIQPVAFMDPTHCRFIPGLQINYWNRAARAALGVSQYRVRCNWKLLQYAQVEIGGGEFRVLESRALLEKEP